MDTKTYTLTEGERKVLLDLNGAAAQRRLAIYELNVQLEQAQKERDNMQSLLAGALSMLANSHGLAGGQLAPDFSTITEQK